LIISYERAGFRATEFSARSVGRKSKYDRRARNGTITLILDTHDWIAAGALADMIDGSLSVDYNNTQLRRLVCLLRSYRWKYPWRS
jgi:hypothetical protein